MLTVLSVQKKIWGVDFLRRFAPNSLKLQVKRVGNAEVCFLEYICRNGRINTGRISKKAKEGRNNLVYSGKDDITADGTISIFDPFELRKRLCSNMALEVLEIMEEIPPDLSIGLYDPRGEYSDLCLHILRHTSNFTVVSRNKSLYTEQAKVLLEEQGIVLRVCSKVSALSRCGLIIAPETIREPFVPMSKTVVLTSSKPSVSLPCRVYSKYSFSLPKELEALRPEGVSAEDFGGALYSLCGFYAIGSCVPFVCLGETDTQTTVSLRKYLSSCFGT